MVIYPDFPVSTVQSHKGQLVFARYNGIDLAVLQGRFHYYEGYSMRELTLPVRVLRELGCEKLIISNVTGSVNPDFEMGDVVFIKDHINLMGGNPLRGKNYEEWGPRFPDMKNTYNEEWNEKCVKIAEDVGFRAHLGVYGAFAGPNLETPAEYVFLHRIGADLVGMSTVPEVLVAKHMEMPVLVFSLVSNKCYPPEAIRETSVEDVISVGEKNAPLLQEMLCRILDSPVISGPNDS
jgi:purine-nucleoside phosphorylase